MNEIVVQTGFGDFGIQETEGAITGLRWSGVAQGQTSDLLREAAHQLAAYFDDPANAFDLPLSVQGSPLVHAVAQAMCTIPLGETRTYGDIAKTVGASAQAVGQACGANPIPIIIPCHRVMGAGGKLTGFSGAGGVETKVALLRHEGAGGFLL